MKMRKWILNDVDYSLPQITIQKTKHLIDERTGFLQAIYEHKINPQQDVNLFYYTAIMSRINVCYPMLQKTGWEPERYNGSAGLAKLKAHAGAIGESAERYCSMVYDDTEFIRAPFCEVRDHALNPLQTVLFSEEQYIKKDFPFVRFSPDVPINWLPGFSLTTKKPILVPAYLVYLAYDFFSQEEMIDSAVSTGLACGNTKEEAILTGIYEVVERDSFAIMWLNKLSTPAIVVSLTDLYI